ncbi:hypothetical protein OUZ56_013719 [Daphnia magna]|uniref:Uncharacterized protein n=1 Tax=Daphnia magna TaxID=35525 RepID=A0ABQ9Z6S7_9CRUS|nr:hypothetical protein OUZ56_013719 [Daphnia magna]
MYRADMRQFKKGDAQNRPAFYFASKRAFNKENGGEEKKNRHCQNIPSVCVACIMPTIFPRQSSLEYQAASHVHERRLATPVSNTLHAMGWERVGGLYRYGVGVSRRNRRLNSATTVHRLLSPIPPTEFCLFKI